VVSNDATVLYGQPAVWECSSRSGNWAFGEPPTGGNGHRPAVRHRPLRQLAGAALLAVSSLTSTADPWVEQQQERSRVTTATASRSFPKRRISPAEARQIALDILYRAEQRREQAARYEAACGINWEEEA
jgi:hypothetical protein